MSLDERIRAAADARELSYRLFVDVVFEDLIARHMLGEEAPQVTADSAARIFRARDRRGRVIRLGAKQALTRLIELERNRLLFQVADGRFDLPWIDGDLDAKVDHRIALIAAVAKP